MKKKVSVKHSQTLSEQICPENQADVASNTDLKSEHSNMTTNGDKKDYILTLERKLNLRKIVRRLLRSAPNGKMGFSKLREATLAELMKRIEKSLCSLLDQKLEIVVSSLEERNCMNSA